VAVLTGDTNPAVVGRLVRGGIRVLHKPLQFEALQACIAELSAPYPSSRPEGGSRRLP
jgi:hypothetical protein